MANPLDAVRAQAEASANARGATLRDCGLRIFADGGGEPAEVGGGSNPIDLGRTYELLLAPQTRRKTGTHLTPEVLTRHLVGLLPDHQPSDTVLDPAVGGGAFLLASADRLVAAGCDPTDVLSQLHGFDIDPGAVAVAEAALALWALDHNVTPRPLDQLQVGDGLLVDLPTVDRVVGNPPFLNQLRSSSTNTAERRARLRDRWGDLLGAYTDDAWLFLAAGVDALRERGALVLVQPVSILAARHAAAVRSRVHDQAHLRALWVGRDRVFDAAVQVCGVAVTRRDAAVVSADTSVDRFVGASFEPCPPLPQQPASDEWGFAAAATVGVPPVHLNRDRTVGDLANATAGFRDQFYGLKPFVEESKDDEVEASNLSRLVTVGMIEPLQLDWGEREFPFAKQSYLRPVVDVDALRRDDPKLGEWVDQRCRPKILMATQTRIVELWVDTTGQAVPTTPVLSIEPLDPHDPEQLWLLAAALSAPAVTAHFLASKFGTAMALNSMKLAARDVLTTPLPVNESRWHQAAELVQALMGKPEPAREEFELFATRIGQAYGVENPTLDQWWLNRMRNRS